MGFFFSDPADRIQFHELDKHLQALRFTPNERAELKKHFEAYKTDGITKKEIDKVAKSLKIDTSDRFSSFKADKLKEGLYGRIEQKAAPKENAEEARRLDQVLKMQEEQREAAKKAQSEQEKAE